MDWHIPVNLKAKFYRTTRPALLYGTKCLATKKHVNKMSAAAMKFLRWMCGETRKDKINTCDSFNYEE